MTRTPLEEEYVRSEWKARAGSANRRSFLAGCLGVGAGVAAPPTLAASMTRTGGLLSSGVTPRPRSGGGPGRPIDRMDVLGIPRDGTAVGLGLHPFAPERTLVLPSGRRLRDACASSGRSPGRIFEALERRWAERGYRTEPMAPEKQDAIAWIIDGMTRHYHRTELFDDWATALMGRESLGSTGMGCYFRLPHQFQH